MPDGDGVSALRKYPRTPHLPWSPGAANDDTRLLNVTSFLGREVVVTEKMDGECTTIHRSGIYARSLDSGSHPSRDYVRALAGRVGHDLPNSWRVVGENLYATHSIHYEALPAYFLAFGLHEDDRCLSWDDTVAYIEMIGFDLVPVLYRGPWDEETVRACFTGTSRCGGQQEGYVVRLAEGFALASFAQAVAKYVRKEHVQTDEHWLSKNVVPNKLVADKNA